ncbi:MAG: AbrB/MazE/SpoVT family DNA-binding domain-containing protein [Promethearchaeota archaeon]
MIALNHTAIINQRGMITIPAKIRQKNKLTPGTEVVILELDGVITLIPVMTEDQLQNDLIPHQDMIQIYEQSKKQDVENEADLS